MKIFELYSGMGGMHFALKESGVNVEIIKAIDINPTANAVYKLNFPDAILYEKNIQCLTEDDFNECNIDLILLSPPCQPHTRNGHRKDILDNRSNSLLHFFELLPRLKTVQFLLLENVKGFEVSVMRNELISLLDECGFLYQEFLLSPVQFSIPNARLRYYLLAKRKPLQFSFIVKNCLMDKLPKLQKHVEIEISSLLNKYKKIDNLNSCYPIEKILESKPGDLVPDNLLKKYGALFDIVSFKSTQSCCFTKGYKHFVEGTGSVVSPRSSLYIKEVKNKLKHINNHQESFNLLKSLQLRYFSPREISKLMAFPDELIFPENLSDKQMYRLLGNSINVFVVAVLIKILVS